MSRRIALVVLALPFLLGHGDGGCGHDDEGIEFGDPTGATCPDGSTLTYDSFGRGFMDDYCVRCHSSEVTGDDRKGAPSDHNFDTQFEIQSFHDHIDWMAGAGPDAVNTQMPPSGTAPSEAERRQLSEWLACGAP
jgi:hypothetical protein